MWEWLQGLQGGAPAVIGSAAGSALGIISLLIGALFNAYLNRRRDNRLRRTEQIGILTVIGSEIETVIDILSRNAKELSKPRQDFRLPDISQLCRILPKAMDKFYLLPRDAIIAAVNAQTIIDQYSDHMIFIGGTLAPNMPKGRLVFVFPKECSVRLKEINEGSVDILSRYLKAVKEAQAAL